MGSFQMDSMGANKRPIFCLQSKSPSEAIITESVEPTMPTISLTSASRQKLNISKPSLRMDSQAKYGILARGESHALSESAILC